MYAVFIKFLFYFSPYTLAVLLAVLAVQESEAAEHISSKQSPIKSQYDKKDNLGWHYYWDEEIRKLNTLK